MFEKNLIIFKEANGAYFILKPDDIIPEKEVPKQERGFICQPKQCSSSDIRFC
jgi:hypothetical protein